MFFICSVHYEVGDDKNEYIAKVKYTTALNSDFEFEATKATIIGHIQFGYHVKTKYRIAGVFWKMGEDVRVVDGKYLRTDANSIKADNLGELPRY